MKENIEVHQTTMLGGLFKTAREYAPLFFQIGSILFLLLSAYFTSRIAPLASDIRSDQFRIEAIEKYNNETAPLVPRFLVVEQEVKTLKESLDKIESSQLRQEQKLDRLIERSL